MVENNVSLMITSIVKVFLFDENSWEDYEFLSPFLSIQKVMSFM